MRTAPLSRRDRLRQMLADLRLPGALEALDAILRDIDGGVLTAPDAIEQLLTAQIQLRNSRRLQAAMRSSRPPVVKQQPCGRDAVIDPRLHLGLDPSCAVAAECNQPWKQPMHRPGGAGMGKNLILLCANIPVTTAHPTHKTPAMNSACSMASKSVCHQSSRSRADVTSTLAESSARTMASSVLSNCAWKTPACAATSR